MDTKTIIALVVLAIVVILGAVLIAAPTPKSEPFASENVKVSFPLPNGSVSKTFSVSGYARGNWFFEASFPVEIRDLQNNLVGQGIAQAEGDWMTEDFVPFTAVTTVSGYSGPATLVLKKDNPSGLPEHDDAVEIPIVVQ